ncbi:MAG TPA: response regulator, partial [Bryobacteraceae bacterium]|nr:response regulator [Bryobacteraceae bacterium]
MKLPRVLIVEDSQRDLDLIIREFRRAGCDLRFERVETPRQMAAALAAGPWDLIISDNALPSFNAQAALAMLHQSRLDIPFIIVSGMIGEERAVELMKAGASDYVSKQNLSRLMLVVERELREAAERRELERVESELSRLNSERELMLSQRSALLDINNAVIANLDRRSLCQAIFEAVRGILRCNGVLLMLRAPQSGTLETVVAVNPEIASVMAGLEAALKEPGERVLSNGQVLTAQVGG